MIGLDIEYNRRSSENEVLSKEVAIIVAACNPTQTLASRGFLSLPSFGLQIGMHYPESFRSILMTWQP